MQTWSYSSIKNFDQCPKKYFHLKVLKDVSDTSGPAAQYGQDAHKAAEEYIRDGVPLPVQFKFMRQSLDAIDRLPGEKKCEIKLGVKQTDTGYAPCGFFDDDVWWRGVADLIILRDETALCIDYKTGKNVKYADTKQLSLLAGAIFCHYPHIKKVKGALAFVMVDQLITKDFTKDEHHKCLSVFDSQLRQLEAAHDSGVWNPKTSALCKFCPVISCPHNFKEK